MTFKKAEMAKTLKDGLSMIETNPLQHNWWHFTIQLGLALHQFQKKTAVKYLYLKKKRNNSELDRCIFIINKQFMIAISEQFMIVIKEQFMIVINKQFTIQFISEKYVFKSLQSTDNIFFVPIFNQKTGLVKKGQKFKLEITLVLLKQWAETMYTQNIKKWFRKKIRFTHQH